MLTDKQYTEVKNLSQKHESVKQLLKDWEFFMQSPYLETYCTIKQQMVDWNEQLKIEPDQTIQRVIGQDEDGDDVTIPAIKGKIDLFADKDAKEFERVFKYFCEADLLLKSLESLRAKMNPMDQLKADQIATSDIDEARMRLARRIKEQG